MLDENLIIVDGLDYKLYVWRSVDSLNPKRNRFFAEIHRRGGADLESGFFGFTKDESVDVEHDTKLIWFSYWSLDDRFDGTPDTELPVRATYDPVVLQIPSSTAINEKKILWVFSPAISNTKFTRTSSLSVPYPLKYPPLMPQTKTSRNSYPQRQMPNPV